MLEIKTNHGVVLMYLTREARFLFVLKNTTSAGKDCKKKKILYSDV